jgi:hypothetical protein
MTDRIQHLIGIGGCATIVICLVLGIIFFSLRQWGMFLAAGILFVAGVGVVTWEIMTSLSQLRAALYRIIFMHRWGE